MVHRGTILVPTLELLTTWYTAFMPADAPVEHIRPEVFLHRDVDEVIDDDAGKGYARAVFTNFNLARQIGVKIALGSDSVYSPLTPHGEYSAREFKAMVRGGMTPLEAITAATSVGSHALGMSHRIGTIEPRKAADLLVVKKDPTADAEVLYDASNIRWIISNGRLAVEDGRLAY
jgi:imidazolonepropionase-like amidohydrolase